MNAILEALGVAVQRHGCEASCCGTSLQMTKPEVGIGMAAKILDACVSADCVATVCPMCHMNLDSYQGKASAMLGRELSLPILFLPQLMGLAFGLPDSLLMLHRHVAPTNSVLERLSQAEVVKE
jgi:heterodisulfide reductase subunit B